MGDGGLGGGLEFEDGGGHGAAELELAGGVVVDGVWEEGEVVSGDHAGVGDGVGVAGGGVGADLAGADFGAVGEAREWWVVWEDLAEDEGDGVVLVGVFLEAAFEETEGGGVIGGGSGVFCVLLALHPKEAADGEGGVLVAEVVEGGEEGSAHGEVVEAGVWVGGGGAWVEGFAVGAWREVEPCGAVPAGVERLAAEGEFDDEDIAVGGGGGDGGSEADFGAELGGAGGARAAGGEWFEGGAVPE